MDIDDQKTAFTLEQVLRISGLSRRRLLYWIDKEIITPKIQVPRGRRLIRLFSFRDLLEIRVARWLRDKVSLQLIATIVSRLRSQGWKTPLASITFGVIETGDSRAAKPDYEVAMRYPDGGWERWKDPGQLFMELTVPIERLADEVRRAIDADRRSRRRVGQVERRRGVLGSTPVIAGTRVPTSSIRGLHEAGYSTQRILDSYPGITEADVQTALHEERRRRAPEPA